MTWLQRLPKVLVIAVVATLLAGLFVFLQGGGDTHTVTAHFSRAVALYPGSEVRILGVRVGEVTTVVPEGNTVRVEMTYDAEYDVPADAQAVIITPTLTADRFVQLTPAYTSGAKLSDGAAIEVQDTGTPVELDRIYRSLSDLTKALGPNGVNKNGTLDNVLTAGSKFLDGEGQKANTTIVNLSRALKTFGDGSGELFSTVNALNDFAGALAANDQAVSQFMGNLGAVSQQLAGEKDELYGALKNLADVLGKVERFVKGNRAILTKDVKDLSRVLEVIAGEQAALATILEVGPMAMGNLVNAFDAKTGTIGSRLNLGPNVASLDLLLCTLVRAGQVPAAGQACDLFKTLLAPLDGAVPSSTSNGSTPSGTSQARYGSGAGASSLSQLMGVGS